MDPLVVHNHLPKTGGKSLEAVVRANYGPAEFIDLDRVIGDGSRLLDSQDPIRAALTHWADYYRSLDVEQRARIRCVVGHQAAFFMPAVSDRPLRAFCMLRDPVDRILSAFFFETWLMDHRGSTGADVMMLSSMRRRGWSLRDAYLELGDSDSALSGGDRVFASLFNGQARQILVATESGRRMPPTADRRLLRGHWEDALRTLDDSYLVGTQNRFSQSVRLFADAFGWRRVFIPHRNVGGLRRHADTVGEETRSLIRAHNQLDAELHHRYSARLEHLPAVGRATDLQERARLRASRARQRLRRRLLRR